MRPPHGIRSIVVISALTACALEPPGGEAPSGDELSVEEQELARGVVTWERPEVGRLGGCTGTLISPKVVLSAAHCFQWKSAPYDGVYDTFTIDRQLANGQIVSTSFKVVHYTSFHGPESDPDGYLTDLALLRLERDVPPDIAVPADIANEELRIPATIYGYGCTDRATGTGADGKKRKATSNQNGTNGPAFKNLCYGDSGGPIFNPDGRVVGTHTAFCPNDGCFDGFSRVWRKWNDLQFVRFIYQAAPDYYVFTGDWNGDGMASPGIVQLGAVHRWLLSNKNDENGVDQTTDWGAAGSIPIAGDWDGDGIDTPGAVDITKPAYVWQQPVGATTRTFSWGGPGWTPIAGDWNGDGIDTPGLVNTSATPYVWRLSNTNASSGVAIEFTWGGPGWIPITGDWNGDGIDTPGLVNVNVSPYQWRLSNRNASGGVDYDFTWGGPGWVPRVADWDGNGTDTPVLFNPTNGQWLLNDRNAGGPAYFPFQWGPSGRYTFPGAPVFAP